MRKLLNQFKFIFESEIESKFKAEYIEKNLFSIRTGFILCITLYSAFGILDKWIVPETFAIAWTIRFAIVLPVLIGTILISYSSWFKDYNQQVLVISSVIVGFGIVVIIGVSHASELGYQYYYSGLILVLLWIYTILRLRFFNSLIAGTCITFGYEFVAIFIQHLPFDQNIGFYVFINNNFFLFSGNIVGLFASYHMERLHRSDFQQNQKILSLSFIDALTGLYNRRKLDQSLVEEMARSIRSKLPLSVMIIDIDHFKLVNDDFGHQVGDEVLVMMASILEQMLRKTDILGRWGGEEFMILCPYTAIEGAVVLAEKIRKEIEVKTFQKVGKRTCSVGVSQYFIEELTRDCIQRADDALYIAKKTGRNRVEHK